MLSGRGLCDDLITRPEESYRLCRVVVCDLETSRMGAPYIYDISRLRVKRTERSIKKEGKILKEIYCSKKMECIKKDTEKGRRKGWKRKERETRYRKRNSPCLMNEAGKHVNT